MIVSCGSDGDAEQILIVVHRLDYRAKEEQELRVFRRRFAGIEQIDPRVGGQRPVVVFAAAVYAVERLFMEQANEPMLFRRLLHDFHRQLVMVGGNIRRFKHGRKLVLGRRRFVVLRLGRDAQFPQFFVQIFHERLHAGFDHAVVMSFGFLTLWRFCAEQRTPCVGEIFSLFEQFFVDQEVFLFGTDRRFDGRHVVVAEQFEHAHRLTVDGFHGTEQGGFLIQRFAAVRTKRRGNTQHAVFDESVGSGVPSGVSARFKGGAQAARRERRSVRFAFDELLSRKFHDDSAVLCGGDETVVFFGGDARHGLEPMGEMGGAVFDRPVFHGGGNGVRHGHIQTSAVLHRPLKRFVDFGRKTALHHLVVEHHTAKIFGNTFHIICS